MSQNVKSVVVYVENNKVVNKEIVDGDVRDVAKIYAKKLIDIWDPELSDFVVLRDQYTLSLKLPLSKDLVEKLRRYSIRRERDKAIAIIPIYEIAYSSKWGEDSFEPDKYVIIIPEINENVTNEITNAIISTFSRKEEEIEEGEEFLEE